MERYASTIGVGTGGGAKGAYPPPPTCFAKLDMTIRI